MATLSTRGGLFVPSRRECSKFNQFVPAVGLNYRLDREFFIQIPPQGQTAQ